ncbi:MAG: LysM peptidoglycan-binding domain-containing protein [Candidatus Omnitrophica bacterium]|nr:LysM peptidoglycan-binding domain-containing protein [Candidatus Omnitrophota bacterium]
MKRVEFVSFIFVGLMVGVTGCARITSQVVEKPRVDQELKGNRGYLAGSAGAAPARKQTRQIVQTDIEMPTLRELNPWKVPAKESSPRLASAPAAPPAAPSPAWAGSPEEAPSAPMEEEEVAVPSHAAPAPEATPYTVQRGDTLEKIAAKVYGDSSQWRRIYKANQDKLKGPNRIYPGQKLVIPPKGQGTSHSRRHRHSAPQSDLK